MGILTAGEEEKAVPVIMPDVLELGSVAMRVVLGKAATVGETEDVVVVVAVSEVEIEVWPAIRI